MSQTLRSALEERVVAAVREGEEELVALVSDLVAFDTTARNVGDPPRQEAELQEYLRRRLAALGADVDVWEPEPTGTGQPRGAGRAGLRRAAAARRAPARRGRRPLSPPQRPHRRGLVRAARPLGEPSAQAGDPRRAALRSRQLRHEGRHRRHALRARDGDAAGRDARRRRRLLHRHGRGVERRRRLRVRRARRARRRRPLRRAHGLRRLGGLPRRRQPDGPHASAAPATPRCTTRTGARAGRSTPSTRWSSCSRACAPCARTGAAARSSSTRTCTCPHVLPTVIKGGEWMVTYPSSCEAVLSRGQYMPGR